MNCQYGCLVYLTVLNGIGDKDDSTEDQQLLSCHYIQYNIEDRDPHFDSNQVRHRDRDFDSNKVPDRERDRDSY
ncbi:unnamed protein product [Rotaria sordida]|uniref:Uncharacterized protein n=1 Tax=Rotaria sordida TaxID=392033 RepID=A0A814Y5E3_9BILA|nr:unnamed protein product [Rotaria sordida]CAF1224689.1 unnamed protein product [Rotaria sordida]CAF1227188.1 unnamed protein product [Rotaria sordida]CAF1453463.1 unnamed protein product [Rotaria sordida]CAF4023509.1 unnamed protein product [Rotaria sordida]